MEEDTKAVVEDVDSYMDEDLDTNEELDLSVLDEEEGEDKDTEE